MKQWMVITPTYEVVEPVTDEGQGPIINTCDIVEVEANHARDAIAFGVKLMLNNPWRPHKWENYHWCRDQQSDGLCPYTGVRALLLEDDGLNVLRVDGEEL